MFATMQIPDATINLGSLALAKGDPASALKLYDRASKHFHHRNVQVRGLTGVGR
jgi:hypothetical protein